MIIDGGPRKNFNTASMLQKFAEGATSVSSDIEVKTVRLYDLETMNVEEFREYCLSLTDVTEATPFEKFSKGRFTNKT